MKVGRYSVGVQLPYLTLMVAERLLAGWQWAVLFAAGTIGGQVAAYASGETGGGDSIAICGLAGGVAVALVAAPGPVSPSAASVVTYYVAMLAVMVAPNLARSPGGRAIIHRPSASDATRVD